MSDEATLAGDRKFLEVGDEVRMTVGRSAPFMVVITTPSIANAFYGCAYAVNETVQTVSLPREALRLVKRHEPDWSEDE